MEIEQVHRFGKESSKGMVIHVTDPDLLEKTGGIVQGMSGSPILQNGKLVGAVTHVFVNDPTRGYGIFIENMLEAAEAEESVPIGTGFSGFYQGTMLYFYYIGARRKLV